MGADDGEMFVQPFPMEPIEQAHDEVRDTACSMRSVEPLSLAQRTQAFVHGFLANDKRIVDLLGLRRARTDTRLLAAVS